MGSHEAHAAVNLPKVGQIIPCWLFKYLPPVSAPYLSRTKSFSSVTDSDSNRPRCSLHSVAGRRSYQALACGDLGVDSAHLNQLHVHGHVVPR